MSLIQTNSDTKKLRTAIAPEELDFVLMLQFLVGWAGEGLTEPPRLSWWNTQLLDEWGGEDLFKRLVPRTYEWALLEATRRVAIQADRRKRTSLAQPDRICTLFFWGFGIDEKLEERLLFHKQNCSQPYDVLNNSIGYGEVSSPSLSFNFPLDLKNDFEKKAFEQAIQKLNPEAEYKIVPEGREVKGTTPESIADTAKNLISGLIPLTDNYPMPFYRLKDNAV